jgi:thymidylate kinase
MFSVALIGPDGAGKTTVVRRLETSLPLPVRTLYMGINLGSSNVSLPTTRLAARLKHWLDGRLHRKANNARTSRNLAVSRKKGRLWASLRLLNHLAEEWYRQLLSWKIRKQGFLVLYDRYFQFDFEPERSSQPRPLSDRLHRWLLAHCYPSPDLTIYLDAPGDVLFARKREASVEWLEARRQAFLRQGHQRPNFIRVDATQPLDVVFRDVSQHIMDYAQAKFAGRLRARPRVGEHADSARSG